MPANRLLRACLTVAIAMVGVAADERQVARHVTVLAGRAGLRVPMAAARPLTPRIGAFAAALAVAPKPEPFFGVATSDLGRDAPAGPPAAPPDAPPEREAELRSGTAVAPSAEPGEPSPPVEDMAPVLAGGEDDDAPKGPVLVSIGRETWVLAEPRWESKKLGYLRAGAIVGRADKPASRRDCRGGWYRIEPEGYVCVGQRATLEASHPAAQLSKKRPDRTTLPYLYALTRYPTPPLYARLPSAQEQEGVEGNLAGQLRQAASIAQKPDYVAPPEAEPMPELVAHGDLLPAVSGDVRRADQLLLGHAKKHSGWAFVATYEQGGRRFGLTTELALVPLDRTRIVRPSAFHGIELSDEVGLPVAVSRARSAKSYGLDAAGTVSMAGSLAHRSVLPLTGREHRSREGLLLEVRDGSWVRASDVTVIEREGDLPRFAKGHAKWLDVSILRQSLVAYEGPRPVYATLVSTGKDGIADHKDSHATIQGTFVVHTKHLSVTMDSDDEKDEFDLRDVPYVQYFTEGYALHAAYWHDDFGNPRSHGCVNLAPIDAAWLFDWTTPGVPEGWHAAMSLKDGTIVHIHP